MRRVLILIKDARLIFGEFAKVADALNGMEVAMNVGKVDRVLRIIVGLILIGLVFVGPQTAWGWIGLVPLLTGLAGRCPAYSLIGVNTCGR